MTLGLNSVNALDTSENTFHNKKLSDKGDIEFTNYISKLYNKNDVISSYKNTTGQVIDCIKIEKQPSLNRKNVKAIEIPQQPTDIPLDFDSSPYTLKQANIFNAPKQDKYDLGCDDGAVPITRLNINELRKYGSIQNLHRKYHGLTTDVMPDTSSSRADYANHLYGVGGMYSTPNFGGESYINFWNPSVEHNMEFSLSQIWVGGGSGLTAQTLEAGWQKLPNYSGSYPRFFVYSTTRGYQPGYGCYEPCTQTNGFVVTNSSFNPIGQNISSSSISVLNGPQYDARVKWYRDRATGHWWLQYQNAWIGYYPTNRFSSTGLKDQANRVSFGGEVVDLYDDGRMPKITMGSSILPSISKGFGQVAYHRRMRYTDTSYVDRDLNNIILKPTNNCYSNMVYTNLSNDTQRVTLFYGGPGYNGVTCK